MSYDCTTDVNNHPIPPSCMMGRTTDVNNQVNKTPEESLSPSSKRIIIEVIILSFMDHPFPSPPFPPFPSPPLSSFPSLPKVIRLTTTDSITSLK